jgi:hypothetical protein
MDPFGIRSGSGPDHGRRRGDRVASKPGVPQGSDRGAAVSRIVLRVAQIIGVLVLAGLAIGIVVGLVQWLLGIAVIVALVAGGWWVFKKVSGRDAKPAIV